MNEKQILSEVQADLQRGRFVLYLEGKTDPQVLFALLGVPAPAAGIHGDVYVRGLDNASGGSAVRARIAVAAANGLGLRPGTGGVAGAVDGDGRDLATLAAEFDPPCVGPLFSWKAYCIENLLARVTWPSGWGPAPAWPDLLRSYFPYAALNRVHVELRSALETLGLEKFRNPQSGRPLESAAAVKAALAKDKNLLSGRDVEAMFDAEVAALEAAVQRSVEEGHAFVNGKWFLRHYAAGTLHRSEEKCRDEWCDAVRQAGGLVEARGLWQRVTGTAP